MSNTVFRCFKSALFNEKLALLQAGQWDFFWVPRPNVILEMFLDFYGKVFVILSQWDLKYFGIEI